MHTKTKTCENGALGILKTMYENMEESIMSSIKDILTRKTRIFGTFSKALTFSDINKSATSS